VIHSLDKVTEMIAADTNTGTRISRIRGLLASLRI
jgi:hypothetical protein